MEKTVSIL